MDKWYRMMDALKPAHVDALPTQIATANGALLPAGPTEVLFFNATTIHFESAQADAFRYKGGQEQ